MNKMECLFRVLTLIVCFGVISSFTIMDRSKENQQTDFNARVIYLVNILRQIKKLTDSHSEERDISNSLLDTGGGFESEKQYPDLIGLQKKDYAILPPSSEWCRMMGFRTCRHHS